MATLQATRRSAGSMPLPRDALELLPEATQTELKMRRMPFAGGFAAVMPAEALIDTGAILALLDRSDRWHQLCVSAFHELRLPLLTSEAVLTELFHLVGDAHVQMEVAWKFIRSGALVLGSVEHAELPYVHTLMTRYWDRPMDLADATLVYLAKRESLSTILTVDYADFETYRIEGKRQFRVLPSNRP
jgi:uncharacterized protein